MEEKVNELIRSYFETYPERKENTETIPIEIGSEAFVNAYDKVCEEADKGNYDVRLSPDIPENEYQMLRDEVLTQSEYDAMEDFRNSLSFEDREIVENYEDDGNFLIEALYNNGYLGTKTTPEKEYMPAEVNLLFETPCEANHDACSVTSTLRDMCDGYSGDLSDYTEILSKESPEEQAEHFDNMLCYLIHQQGYTVSEFAEVFYRMKETDSVFLNSLADAYSEATSNRAELAVSLEATEKDFETMRELAVSETVNRNDVHQNFYKPGYNDIDSLTETAVRVLCIQPSEGILLFDKETGSGSSAIALEKPLQIPLSMLDYVQVEKGRTERSFDYTINDVYGSMDREASYRIEDVEHLEIVHEPVSSIVETLHEINDKIEILEQQQEYASLAADFLSREDLSLEVVSETAFRLFDKNVQDYRRDENGHSAQFSSFEEIVENLDVKIQKRLENLENYAKDFEEFISENLPATPKEWSEYLEENPKAEFARIYEKELKDIDILANPDKVDMKLVCENLGLEIPKEKPEKQAGQEMI